MTDNFNFFCNRKPGDNTFFFPITLETIKSQKGYNYRYYYTVELIRRKKDNPDLDDKHFWNYYIYSPDDLKKYEQEIKDICNALKCRAYISVNMKDIEQITKNTLVTMSTRIATNDYNKTYRIFESESGSYVMHGDKKLILDIDNVSIDDLETINKYAKIANQCRNDKRLKCRIKYNMRSLNKFVEYTGDENDQVYDNVICTIPTITGIHLITYAFNQDEFNKKLIAANLPLVDIKENHITLLYENI